MARNEVGHGVMSPSSSFDLPHSLSTLPKSPHFGYKFCVRLKEHGAILDTVDPES